ncbi:hypothetical protein SKAU_G00154080 [Synaphobranchus kaupii]|uniref:Cyclin N-terminal domain-containing protein n=1 Tax=Synaphobranchus kaupii TaxID=118154 RepID=A0A9Q1FH68_SYNKA|nr:hypothetical protein SKAU_G00154080 [Synaphobranchus kaupii]
MDLSAAFDTVDQAIAIDRLKHGVGVKGTALGWFASFFRNRTFSVNIGNLSSSRAYITCGVPQGVKLGMHSVPVATACTLYHRFFQSAGLQVYEPYLVAMSAIYLAGKVEEQHMRTRDIINVCHRYMHVDSEPLELNSQFWELRDSVVQCELLILRQLNFQVSFQHPHKVPAQSRPSFLSQTDDDDADDDNIYLLHYLLSLKALLNRHAWSRTPISETAWALLKDSYHGPLCVEHAPQHLAVAVLYLALHTYGVEVPLGAVEWWQGTSPEFIQLSKL